MKKKIIFFVWPSWSWKTTTESLFLEYVKKNKNTYGEYNRIVSHATRTARKEELDEINNWVYPYYFISEKDFLLMYNNNEFLQTIKHAGTYKWSSYEEWNDKLNKWNILMSVLKESLYEIRRNLKNINRNDFNEEIIFFDIDINILLDRLSQRYSNDFWIEKELLLNSFKILFIDNNFNKKVDNEWKTILLSNIYGNLKNISDLNFEAFNKMIKDVELRINDIEYLSEVKKISSLIIGVENKSKEDILNELINYIDNNK